MQFFISNTPYFSLSIIHYPLSKPSKLRYMTITNVFFGMPKEIKNQICFHIVLLGYENKDTFQQL